MLNKHVSQCWENLVFASIHLINIFKLIFTFNLLHYSLMLMSPPALAGMSARVEQRLIHHLKTRGNESDSDCCFCFSVFYHWWKCVKGTMKRGGQAGETFYTEKQTGGVMKKEKEKWGQKLRPCTAFVVQRIHAWSRVLAEQVNEALLLGKPPGCPPLSLCGRW